MDYYNDPIMRKVLEQLEKQGYYNNYKAWDDALFRGAPQPLSPEEARGIAQWLRDEAPIEWDEKKEDIYDAIADIIDEVAQQAENGD